MPGSAGEWSDFQTNLRATANFVNARRAGRLTVPA